ncbi:MAG: hypothetical protein JNL89_10385, partial [Rhodanobacteraceae bacterium]|nr:hypothetical protein [Rhodanobacteraceae bacterium]
MSSLARSIALGLLLAASGAHAAPWTYRGTLSDGGAPANGRYDIRLSVLDASGAKALVYPLTFSGVEVKDGAFAVDVDFGVDLGQLGAVKLKTEVAQGGSGFVALGEPQAFDAKAALVGVCWDTQGNAGTNPATDFLGTTDNQALVLRVNNQRALAIAPNSVSPNLAGGFSGNSVTPGVAGATISGGGFDTSENSVTDDYGTIGGGANNVAGDGLGTSSDRRFATVGGGSSNTASALQSTVGGGNFNTASALQSTVGGGVGNTASAFGSTVAGGSNNTASGNLGAV